MRVTDSNERKGELGLTLLELLVVVSIMSILAALTGVAVTGSSTAGRGGAVTEDKKQVQDSVSNYSVQHPRSQYPTFNGCLPGQDKQTDGSCKAGVAPGSFDVTDKATWEAVIWGKSFKDRDGNTKTLVPDLLRKVPKHGEEHSDNTPWTRTLTDPDGVVINLKVPDQTGSQDTATSSKVPVYVLDKNGDVHVTIAASAY